MSTDTTEAPNTGHGHVRPRPDGIKARCGGPAFCRVCQQERAALAAQPAPAPDAVPGCVVDALRRLVARYVKNIGTPHEFISCITTDHPGSETWREWGAAIRVLATGAQPAPAAVPATVRNEGLDDHHGF